MSSVPASDSSEYYALLSVQDVTDLTSQIQDYRNVRDQALAEVRERQRAEAELHQTLQIKEELAATATAQSLKLEYALQDLQKTQAQLIQTEKMSSLGQLVAGVAHEINNPVNFIHGNLPYLNKYTQDLLALIDLYQRGESKTNLELQNLSAAIDLAFLVEDMPKIVSSMQVGVDRIRDIVRALRNFSRFDEAEMKPVNIHEGLDSTLLILQNRLKDKPENYSIQIIKNYGNLPKVECYAGQMNQVFMNVLSNAIDALESYNQQLVEEIRPNPSQIAIHTEVLDQNWISVRILDNGAGMAEEVRKQLFNPFFTTKPIGQGMGLGLSISYQIVVDKHGGLIGCESKLGEGTEFWIQIPIYQSKFMGQGA